MNAWDTFVPDSNGRLCLKQKYKALPPEILQIKGLRSLVLYGDVHRLPDMSAIGLTELSICRDVSKHKSLQPELLQITTLLRLHVSAGIWDIPPQIGNLVNLTALNLAENMLYEIPSEISLLANLTSLDLTDNFLQKLPDELSNMTKLETLLLAGNQLRSLNINTDNLCNIHTLNMSVNRMRYLPEGILNLTSLRNLILREAHLCELPATISRLSNLTSLDLTVNCIEILPPEIGLLTNLCDLFLSSNNLKRMPDEFSQLQSLNELVVSYNRLSNIDSICRLRNLKGLHIACNKIKTIPLFDKYPKRISTIGNPLQWIPSRLIFMDKKLRKSIAVDQHCVPTSLGEVGVAENYYAARQSRDNYIGLLPRDIQNIISNYLPQISVQLVDKKYEYIVYSV